jgi:hypothetical protein
MIYISPSKFPNNVMHLLSNSVSLRPSDVDLQLMTCLSLLLALGLSLLSRYQGIPRYNIDRVRSSAFLGFTFIDNFNIFYTSLQGQVV